MEAILEAMTLQEKLGQLTMVVLKGELAGGEPDLTPEYVEALREGRFGSIVNLTGRDRVHAAQRCAVEETRLGIPLLFALDVLHGYRSIFPIPLGEAAAFDESLWEHTARAAAEEATAAGIDLTFAPALDVSRDPRWGRIAESPGEDPWLSARFASAKIRGFQASHLASSSSLAATAKHLGAYGAVTAGRDYASVDVSDRQLHEVYLPPFRTAVSEDVAAVMPSFNDLAGVPMTANLVVLRNLLRARWGFDGVIISDYGAIRELIEHGIAADLAEAAALALRAGVDIDLMGGAYAEGLPGALARGIAGVDEIDVAVRRVLRLKQRLGLLDDPYRRCARSPALPSPAMAPRELARESARRSIVLLTNRSGRLPVTIAPKRVGLIGPLAEARAAMLGTWSCAGKADDVVSIRDGIIMAWPKSTVLCEPGVAIEETEVDRIDKAVTLAESADLVLLCLGEDQRLSGEAASRGRPGLPGRQVELAQAVLALGRPVIMLLAGGRPLLETALIEQVDAVLMLWAPGSEAGHAVADVLTGRWNPSAGLPVTWPVDVGQIPIFYSQRPSGRPADPANPFTSKYLDLPTEPLFPFGHGLSYSCFEFKSVQVNRSTLSLGHRITLEVQVRNSGPIRGEARILLFAHWPVASVSRPVLELKGATKIMLEPGEDSNVQLTLSADELLFLGPDLVPHLAGGRVRLLVGPCADLSQLLAIDLQLLGDDGI